MYFTKIDNRQGSILIIALWSLCLLTTFVVYSGLIVRQKLNLVGRLNTREGLFFMGESGVNTGILELRKKDTSDSYYALNENWSNSPGAFKNVALSSGSFTISYSYVEEGTKKLRYGLMDETSKININKADVKVLSRLLEVAADLNDQRALSLAHCIVDWRDVDSFFSHPQYGAEDSDYKNLKAPYEAKDADFEVIEELLLIRGMDEEVFGKIEDFITVYGEGIVNINTAPRTVLLILGLSRGLTTKILQFRKGDDSMSGTFDDNVFSSISGIVLDITVDDLLSTSEVEELTNLVSNGIFITKSSDFMIKCLAELNNKDERSEITAIADQDGFIRYWRQNYY
ncbi:general secretion pathway protein GspK [Candidatus Omnitrophota bacterium]